MMDKWSRDQLLISHISFCIKTNITLIRKVLLRQSTVRTPKSSAESQFRLTAFGKHEIAEAQWLTVSPYSHMHSHDFKCGGHI